MDIYKKSKLFSTQQEKTHNVRQYKVTRPTKKKIYIYMYIYKYNIYM